MLIDGPQKLETKCRAHSQSFFVPLGTEMAYRYQDEFIAKLLVSLKFYRGRIMAASED